MPATIANLSSHGKEASANKMARDRALISAKIAVTTRFVRPHPACQTTTHQDLEKFWHLVDNVMETGSSQAITATASFLLPRIGTADHVTAVTNYFIARCVPGAAGTKAAPGGNANSKKPNLLSQRLSLCFVLNSLMHECMGKAEHANAESALLSGLRPVLTSLIMDTTGSFVSAMPKVHFGKLKSLIVSWHKKGFFDQPYLDLLADAARGRLPKPGPRSAAHFGDPSARWHDLPTTIITAQSTGKGDTAVDVSSLKPKKLESGSNELELHGALLALVNEADHPSEHTLAGIGPVAPGTRSATPALGWSRAFAREENMKKRKRSDSSVGPMLERTRVDRSFAPAAARGHDAPRGPANRQPYHHHSEQNSRGQGGRGSRNYYGYGNSSRGGGGPSYHQQGGYGRGRGNTYSHGSYQGRPNDRGRRHDGGRPW